MKSLNSTNSKMFAFFRFLFFGLMILGLNQNAFSAAPGVIDLFTAVSDPLVVRDTVDDSVAVEGFAADTASIIGGRRDLSSNLIFDSNGSPQNGTTIYADFGQLSFDNDALSGGEGIIQWDATAGLVLNPTGLGGIDLWAEGDTFTYNVISLDLAQFQIRIEAYSSATQFTKVTVRNSAVGQYLIPFANLEDPNLCGFSGGLIISVECGTNGNVDLSNLGALQAVINVGAGTPEVDLAIGPVTVVRVNAELGDRVWLDQNGNGTQECTDTNGNGILGDTDPSNPGNPALSDQGAECDAGVPGLPVNLYPFSGGVCDTGTALRTTFTDEQGFYFFTDLIPGSYCVKFTKPENLCQFGNAEFTLSDVVGDDARDSDADRTSGQTGVISLIAGETNRSVDAGIYCPSRLGDQVWEDLNADGIQDGLNQTGGEPGFPGIGVKLLDCSGNPVLDGNNDPITATTNSDGSYIFSPLPPGQYIVEFAKPANYQFSPKNSGGSTVDSDVDVNGRTECITLPSDTEDLTWDAGLYRTAGIGDFLWEDLNRDGIQDPTEPGVPNGAVSLVFSGNDGICGNSDDVQVLPDQVTDADGAYEFNGLTPGKYCYVQFAPPTNYCTDTYGFGGDARFTLPNEGGDDLKDSDADPATGRSVSFTLLSNQFQDKWDAGIYCPARLGDQVWIDINADGVQDGLNQPGGELGIGNVTVNLLDCNGNPVLDNASNPVTTVTDGFGVYLFDPLEPGNYIVEFVKPGGYVFSPQDQGVDNGVDSDASPNGQTQCINLPSGKEDLTWDAGLYQSAGVGDFLWEDKNRNGVQDSGEPGIDGGTVRLVFSGDNGLCGDGDDAEVIPSEVTAGGGGYLFDGLTPGLYCYLEFLPPQNYCGATYGFGGEAKFTLPNEGGNDLKDSDVDPNTGRTTSITLLSNELQDQWDAGVYCPAQLGDLVWLDLDRDGIQDAVNQPGGEPGVAGVQVELLLPGDDGQCNTGDEVLSASGSRVTADGSGVDPLGAYLFDNLLPGNYCVEFVKPAGMDCTDPNVTPPANPSEVDSDAIPGASVCQTRDPVEDPIQLQSGESDRSWDAGLVELAQPEIRIVKFTNGLDANDPVNGNDIPVVAPGGEVTWTYKVTNTGTVNIPEGDISVTDNIIGAVTTVDKGGDATPAILEPNESWIYSAVGTALDLVSAPDAPNLLANACNNVSGSVPGSRAYTNLGTVTIPTMSDEDPSSYCNPPPNTCEICVGVKQMTLKISASAWNRDQDETIRVRANSATGTILWSGKVATYSSFSFEIPAGVEKVYVSVQGKQHPSEYVKAIFLTDCDLKVGASDGNSYITFKVIDLTQRVEIASGSACGGGLVCGQKFEAEDGELNGLFGVYQSASFSGGAYVKTPDNGVFMSGPSSSFVQFKLNLTDDQLVKLMTGVYSPSGNSDSFWVTIDDQPVGGYLYDTASGGLVTDYVNDRNGRDGGDPVMVSLATGDHVIRFYLREDGTKLDWLKAECSVPEAPSIDIRKQAEGPDSRTFSPGDTVPFEIVVTNTGNVDLSNVAVSDALVPNCDNTIGALTAGDSVTYSCNTVLPSGGGIKTFRDEFNAMSYSNNDGTHDFSGPWVEYDVAGAGPTAGNVLVGSNDKLWLDDYPDTGTEPSAKRSVDLTGAVNAKLEFDWQTHDGVDNSDEVVVEISSDGGISYTVLHAFTGFSGAMSGHKTFDISAYISAETTVRFRVSRYYGGSSETFKVDNLMITAEMGGGASGFNNEACVSGTGAGQTVSDCDTSEVVVEDAPGNCPVCDTGITRMTLKIIYGASNRPADERIRVRENGLDGAVLYDSYDDGNPNPTIPTGSDFTFDIPHPDTKIVVTVQGSNHPSEYIKATFATDCGVRIGDINGNDYIKFNVTNALIDGVQICGIGSDGTDSSWHNGYKHITVLHSGKCLDVEGRSTNDGAKLQQWDCHGGDNQTWELIPHSSGAYQLRAKHSGKCMDGYWAVSGEGVKQWSCATEKSGWINNQLFNVSQNSDGSFKLLHSSGKSLDVAGSSQSAGAEIILWSDHGGANQRWNWN